MALITGTVLWFNTLKGFGFLSAPETSDVFCQYSAILCAGYKVVHEGDPVEFEIVTGETGRPQAANARVIRPATGHITRPLTAALPKAISEYN